MQLGKESGELLHATAGTPLWATAAVKAMATPPQEVRPHQPSSNSWPLCPSSGFVEIAQTLRREEPMESSLPPVITGIPTQEVVDPYKVMGTAMTVARLL